MKKADERKWSLNDKMNQEKNKIIMFKYLLCYVQANF